MNTLRRTVVLGAALMLLSMGSGCYSTRTNLPAHVKTIAVPTFENRSYNDEYTRKLEVELTEAVRQTFLQNGQLTLVGRDKADLILEGAVMRLDRQPVRIDRFGEAAETRIIIHAQVELYDVREAKYVFKKTQMANDAEKAESGVYNLRRGEFEGLGRKKAIEDLGRAIARKVLDRW